MIKELVISILIIFLLFDVSALRINEVELNPMGDDSGNEWVEFYNEEEISLEGYKIINNDGNEIDLGGNFSGYFVYTFTKQWLDNSDEGIFLYKNSELIDKTDLLGDSKNNDLTYQLCDSSWISLNSTKGKENDCSEQTDEITNEIEQTNDIPVTETQSQDSAIEKSSEDKKDDTYTSKDISKAANEAITLDTINLNSKDIKSENNKEILKKNLALGGIITFCIGFGALFLLKLNRRENKNEFR